MDFHIPSRKGPGNFLTGKAWSVGGAFLVFLLLLIVTLHLLAPHRSALSAAYEISFLNDRAGEITGAAAVYAPGFVVPDGLTGEGQIVAIADSGLDTGNINDMHPDLRSTPGKMPKIVLLRSWAGRDVPDDPNGHGTHMAATIAGTGAASDGRFSGVASGASIYFQGILNKAGEPELPANLADLFWPAYSAGARIHVNGWGGGPDVYQEAAAETDDFVRNYFDCLVIFGAGNGGPSPGTITSEANSKNALVVGASILPRAAFVPDAEDTRLPAVFSAHGPAGDGRIKPELLAPASAVISARSRLTEGNLPGYPEYTRMQGTSMAAAVAGGSAALLREYLKKDMDRSTPSAALLKAALINGARTQAAGSSAEGFGVIDLAGTIIALKDNSFMLADELAGVTQNEQMSYNFHVADAASPFKATLVWTDPAAEAKVDGPALVNDLNLLVRAPDGKIYYGNHFLGNNRPDGVNNVEQVYLPTPVPGDYTIQVIGAGLRQNAVKGSGVICQDYALVWGQSPATGLVESVSEREIKLAGGHSLGLTDLPVTNLVDGSVISADHRHLLPGSQAYLTRRRTYLTVSLWHAAGVRTLGTAEGTVITEINPSTRLGGYSLPANMDTILLNNKPVSPGALPPGAEVDGVVNPLDQKIRQVRAAYSERTGVVSSIKNADGQKRIVLAGSGGAYPLTDDVVFSYENIYQSVEPADMPFAIGALDELQEVLPGMPVLLRLAPSSGLVPYVAVKRQVILGFVEKVDSQRGELYMEDGASFLVVQGAPVKKDRENSKFDEIKPGDHITAVLLPDTGEAIGLVAYSNVSYGKVVDFIKKDREVYLLDNKGLYRSFVLAPDAVVYRWGVHTQDEAIATGCLVKITTDQTGQKVWRLDIGENFYGKSIFTGYNEDENIITAGNGEQYQISDTTRFYKNGCQVLPADLAAGEQVELEYAIAPSSPTGNILISANAISFMMPASLFVSAVQMSSGLAVTGRCGAGDNVIYVWQEGLMTQTISVDEAGRFKFNLERSANGEYSFTVVALDRRTGGAASRRISLSDGNVNGGSRDVVLKNVAAVMAQALTGAAPVREISNLADLPLTRVAAAAGLAELMNWPEYSEWPLFFTDAADIPAALRPVVAEAQARGIFQGYADGSFRPNGNLTRAEASVFLTAVLWDIGITVNTYPRVSYTDAELIPDWAAESIAVCTAAGLWRGRPDGAFAPDDLITCGEMSILLERLLNTLIN